MPTNRKNKSQLTQRVLSNWGAWRLIFSDIGNFTHDYVFNHMTPQQIDEANIALDIVIEQINESVSKK